MNKRFLEWGFKALALLIAQDNSVEISVNHDINGPVSQKMSNEKVIKICIWTEGGIFFVMNSLVGTAGGVPGGAMGGIIGGGIGWVVGTIITAARTQQKNPVKRAGSDTKARLGW